MYDKLAGMTGTAMTEESEFREIYGLDVIEIPTNKPVRRDDRPDVVYKTNRESLTPLSMTSPPAMKKGSRCW